MFCLKLHQGEKNTISRKPIVDFSHFKTILGLFKIIISGSP